MGSVDKRGQSEGHRTWVGGLASVMMEGGGLWLQSGGLGRRRLSGDGARG